MDVKILTAQILLAPPVNINEGLIPQGAKTLALKTKREIVNRALELFVRLEDRKSILRYHGSGIWKGNYKAAWRNRG